MSDTCNTIFILQSDGTGVPFATTADIQGTTLVSKPTVTVSSYTYNGNSQGPTITGLDTSNTVVTGATATDAGTYTLTIELKDKSTMMWDDITNADLIYTYTINKATPTISLSKTSVTLNSSTTSTTVTVTKSLSGAGDVTATSSNTSIATVSVSGDTLTISSKNTTGTATISVYTASNSNCNQSATSSISVTCSFTPKKTFAAATDAEIAQMVAAADAGEIDLYEDCGWRVGQEHVIRIGSISASGSYRGYSWSVGESQSSNLQITLVLLHRGGYQLVTPVKNKQGRSRTECSFVVGFKHCFPNQGYMNSSSTNSGSWEASARRSWCNGGISQAMSNWTSLYSSFKQFYCITGTSNGTAAGGSNITTQDYFALPAEKEVYGSRVVSTTNEANALVQFTYYETSSNRIKRSESSSGTTSTNVSWWERSPGSGNTTMFCRIYTNGNPLNIYANESNSFSPFGCV